MSAPDSSSHNLMTVKETAAYLRIPLPTVYYLVQRGQLPAIQIGGRWRVKRDALDRDVLHAEVQGQPTVLVVDDDPIDPGHVQALPEEGELIAADRLERARKRWRRLRSRSSTSASSICSCPTSRATKFTRAKEQQPDLPIVIITGFPDSQMLDNILKHGPVTVLKKPLQVEQ